VSKELEKKLDKLIDKVDKLQLTIEELDAKLNKHIGFIDETYEGLRNPINAARKFFGR
tara:strand:- start:1158 stop:1331 length:174 start_codon:yes stop_codon:yes gene_type:complete